MFTTKNERLGLLISTIIFALVSIAQYWRVLSHTIVSFNGNDIPTWVSLFVGTIALLMAIWMGSIFRARRPVS